MITPDKFLKLLRESDPAHMENLFLYGGCFHLFRILSTIWPEAEAWYKPNPGHVYIRIAGIFYDIKGSHGHQIKHAHPMSEIECKKAKRWLPERLKRQRRGNAVL